MLNNFIHKPSHPPWTIFVGIDCEVLMHLWNHVQWIYGTRWLKNKKGENWEPSSLSVFSCSQVDASTEVCSENFKLHFEN